MSVVKRIVREGFMLMFMPFWFIGMLINSIKR